MRRSLIATSTALGIPRFRLVPALHLMASSMQVVQTRSLEAFFVFLLGLRQGGEVQVLNCWRWRKYDETKTRLRVQWQKAGASTKETQGKLMVVEHGLGILLASSPPDHALRQHVLVHIRFCNTCRLADNHTTQTVAHLLLHLLNSCPGVPDNVALHDLVTTDALSTNLAAERALTAAGRAGGLMGNRTAATTLHVTCDVHKASNIAKRMFGLNGMNHIPGAVIKVALCLQGSGHMERLRRHLASVIRSKLVIYRFGNASEEAQRYREKVTSIFLASPRPHVQGFRKVLLMFVEWGLEKEWHFGALLRCFIQSCRRC